jgi:eukaryotic-like serine/threonine-protein kinase
MQLLDGLILDADSTLALTRVSDCLGRQAEIPRAQPRAFLGRYALGEHLGSGSSGSVYRAIDRDRGLPVALKVVHRFGPASLARFKSEFRVASLCTNSCLVALFELVEEGGDWAIAMELVDGPPLLDYVRPWDTQHQARRPHEGRLRQALRSIATGLSVLHEAGIIHRDLKPSNVLVGSDGEVRIGDFGLAKLFDTASSLSGDLVAGTPAYMAPEQGLGRALTPAADLYAVGVLLYEALTGARPFHGTSLEILTEKNSRPAPDPGEIATDAPPELLGLTRRLLEPDPAGRPTVAEVLAVASGDDAPSRLGSPRRERELVGRKGEIAASLQAFDASASGRTALVRIFGPSGVGKSALVRTLTRALEQTRGGTVLRGRCHELESIPHKGFDAIVDSLRGLLTTWGLHRIEAELAQSSVDAVPMFPVLGDVLPFARLGAQAGDEERMRRAREALVTVLRAVSAFNPLVLVLDDAQWGDAGGSKLLEAILLANPACVRMVVLAYRDSEAAGSPLLSNLHSLPRVETRYQELLVPLGPLAPHEARELALTILGSDTAAAERIARDSAGEPFLLEQLALAGVEQGSASVRVEDVVMRRAKAHGGDAFRLVEVAAVAGTPLPERLLTEVAGARDARLAINRLVGSSMLRRSGSGPEALLYPYHDRIRTSVEATVGPERKRLLHRQIAEIGEADGLLTAAALTRHFEAAGDAQRASVHALRAAKAAEEALAFESAAGMYARFLDLSSDETAKQEVRCARARALFIAGRCDEAGVGFELAARHAAGSAARDLQRQAVEALLAFGHIAEALALLVPLLKSENIPYPTSTKAILLAFLKTILETRRLTLFPPRIRETPDPVMVARSDLAWTGKGLNNVTPQQGVILTLASLCFAIRSGDAYRIGRGLSFAACGFVPGLGGLGDRYLRWLSELSEQLNDNRLRILHRVAVGGHCLMGGDWARCVQACFEAVQIAEKTPTPSHWEQTIARMWAYTAYEFMGEFTKMEAESRDYLRVLRARGDRVGEVMIVSGLGYPLAARHDRKGLGEVIADMHRLMNEWTVPPGLWDAFNLRLECLHSLCWGDVQHALALVQERWPSLVAQRLLDLPMVRYPLISVRSAILLESAAARLVDWHWAIPRVHRSIRILARAPRAEGPAAAALAQSGLANLSRRPDQRDAHLQRAIQIAQDGKMRAVELMARRAYAMCHDEAKEVPQLETELRSLGVTEPSAWARYVTPTFSVGPPRQHVLFGSH